MSNTKEPKTADPAFSTATKAVFFGGVGVNVATWMASACYGANVSASWLMSAMGGISGSYAGIAVCLVTLALNKNISSNKLLIPFLGCMSLGTAYGTKISYQSSIRMKERQEIIKGLNIPKPLHAYFSDMDEFNQSKNDIVIQNHQTMIWSDAVMLTTQRPVLR